MTNFDVVLTAIQSLTPLEKLRLMQQLAQELEPVLESNTPQKPRRSLYGIWKDDVSISAEDIDEARREMWGNFPREDI